MDYKSIAFDPPTTRDQTVANAAGELESLITEQSADGWEFIGLQNHSTVVPGSSGCFGIGSSNAYQRTLSMAVFRK
jgi:hypothetical protein